MSAAPPTVEQPPTASDAATLLGRPIIDRDMGEGDRLLRLGEQRARRLRDAWLRDGTARMLTGIDRDPLEHARRAVATRCLYGIAPDRAAVTEARGRLERWAAAPGAPPVCVDHAIRRGHRALGFEPAQLAAFDPHAHTLPAGDDGFARWLAPLHRTHVARRRGVIALAEVDAIAARAALARADAVADTARVIGDVLAASPTDAARATHRALLRRWLSAAADDAAGAEAALRRVQAELRQTHATFHWTSEFSELAPDVWHTPTAPGAPR